MERKGYRPSELMNYLDFLLDINLGDVFNSPKLQNTWLGYSIHHRTSIFESAQQFGRIKWVVTITPSIYNLLFSTVKQSVSIMTTAIPFCHVIEKLWLQFG